MKLLACLCFIVLGIASAKYTILTSAYYPLVVCTTGSVGLEATKFSGIQVDMLRALAKNMNWTDADWQLECINMTDIQAKVADHGNYLGYFGPFTLDRYSQLSGVQFSQPLYQTGLSIITYQENKNFIFFDIVQVNLLLLVVGTAVVVAILQFLFEGRRDKFKQHSLEYYFWHVFSSIFFIGTVKLKQHPSKLIQSGFWFMMFVVVSIYFAKICNELTLRNITNFISSPLHLNQKIVKVNQIYDQFLSTYNARSVKTTYGPAGLYDDSQLNKITETMVAQDLERSGNYRVDAFVTEDLLAQIVDYTQCDKYTRARNFHQLNYPIIYSSQQNATLAKIINQEIVRLQAQQKQLALEESFITTNYKQCKKKSTLHSITLDNVRGLFIIMAIAFPISALLFGITKLPYYQKVLGFLESIHLTQPQSKVQQKQGDELVVQNLKEVTKAQLGQFQQLIQQRLDEMDAKVLSFYKILLNEDFNRQQIEIQKIEKEIEQQIQKVDSKYHTMIADKPNHSKLKGLNRSKANNQSQLNNLSQNRSNREEANNDIDGIIAFSDHGDSDRNQQVIEPQQQAHAWLKPLINIKKPSDQNSRAQSQSQKKPEAQQQQQEGLARGQSQQSQQGKQSLQGRPGREGQGLIINDGHNSSEDEGSRGPDEDDDENDEGSEEEEEKFVNADNDVNRSKDEMLKNTQGSSSKQMQPIKLFADRPKGSQQKDQRQQIEDNIQGVINDDFEDEFLNKFTGSSKQQKKK